MQQLGAANEREKERQDVSNLLNSLLGDPAPTASGASRAPDSALLSEEGAPTVGTEQTTVEPRYVCTCCERVDASTCYLIGFVYFAHRRSLEREPVALTTTSISHTTVDPQVYFGCA